MITYAFDLYPRTDPLGARLVRLSYTGSTGPLQLAEYRGEANGTGSGQFSIRADPAIADFIDPEGLQYVRVVRIDDSIVDGATLSGFDELVDGGFFTERGEVKVLDDNETKLLTFKGAGPLTYLSRAVMDADSWLTTPFIGTDPQPDGTWPLNLAGTGNELGAILWRVLRELEEAGRHQNPLPAMSIGFTHLLDSNGAAWVITTGDFVAQVADQVLLPITRRLMEMGLYVEVDYDTFEVRAYEPGTHRRDRTGASWAADVVRFQAPTAGDIATGNIKSDLTRALEAKVRRNAILVGSNDTWLWVDDPSVTVPWEGGYILDDEDGTSLLKVGEAQLEKRNEAGDTARLRIKLGDDPLNGRYKPFESDGVQLDDIVTLHTGTGQWDYNEAEFPIAALTISLRPGGDWDCWAELGSTFLSMEQRDFQAQPVGHHTHPPNPQLCRPLIAGSPVVVDYGVNLTSGSDALEWFLTGTGTGNKDLTIAGTDRALYVFVLHRHDDGTPTPVWRRAGPIDEAFTQLASIGSIGATGNLDLFRLLAPTAGTGQVLVANASATRVGGFFLTNVNQSDPEASFDTDNPVATTSAGVSVTGGQLQLDAAGYVNAGEASVADPTPSGSQNEAWSVSVDSGADDHEFGGSYGDATPVWTSAASRKWATAAVAVNGVGTGTGDGHADLIGTSIRAKRCDDTEHYHTTADPTVNDDTTLGFRANTLWINESTGDMFLLLDNADGAADWLAIGGGGVTDHGALTGLSDDDHPQYVKDSEFAAKGDLLGGTGASTLDNLAAGSNGSGLVTASGETTGLKWRKHNDAATVAPTVNEDSGDGYEVGSHWLDTTNDKEYVLLDATVGAAVWKERTNVVGGGATIIVREVGGADIEDVAELEFDASDFVVTEPSAGIARVELTSPGGGGSGSERALVDPTGLSWSWLNQGSATINTVGEALVLYGPADATDTHRIRKKTVPSKPYEIIVHAVPSFFTLQYAGVWVGWINGTTNFTGLYQLSVSNAWLANSAKGTVYTLTADYVSLGFNIPPWPWIRLTDDASNRRIYVSRTGLDNSWLLLHTVATNDYLTPTDVGFSVNPRNATYATSLVVDSWEEI